MRTCFCSCSPLDPPCADAAELSMGGTACGGMCEDFANAGPEGGGRDAGPDGGGGGGGNPASLLMLPIRPPASVLICPMPGADLGGAPADLALEPMTCSCGAGSS